MDSDARLNEAERRAIFEWASEYSEQLFRQANGRMDGYRIIVKPSRSG